MTTTYLTCAQAAERYPTKKSATSVWRHMRRGLRSRSGRRIRLQHIRTGRELLTTQEWIAAFHEALAAADVEAFDAADDASAATDNQIAVAEAELASAGI